MNTTVPGVRWQEGLERGVAVPDFDNSERNLEPSMLERSGKFVIGTWGSNSSGPSTF